MKLYFVRHGETKNNITNIHQTKDTELSSRGIQQAKFVANRFRDIPIDIIISSTYLRAQQTTQEIERVLKKQVFYTDLLIEKRSPSNFAGKDHEDADVLALKDMMRKNARLTDWHVADEENFYDVRARGIEFFEYLKLFKEENILAVTHGRFLQVLIGLILLGNKFTYEEYYHFQDVLMANNTGITVCETDDHMHWRLRSWNDHAHLG
jgi:broad specificity phosphatase PhoE